MIGALVMTHSDDDGLVLPPKIASAHVVLIPVVHKEETRASVMEYCKELASTLRSLRYADRPLVVIIDERDMRGGEKTWSWIKKGIPVRIEIGPRDIASGQLLIARRDRGHKDRSTMSKEMFVQEVGNLLDAMQEGLLQKATAFRDEHICKIETRDEFYAFFTPQNRELPEIHGGFAWAHWSGDLSVEETIKEDLGVTIRCIPLDMKSEPGTCPFTGKPSLRRVLYAKSY
jgi:prolyl-tRNA synthetase